MKRFATGVLCVFLVTCVAVQGFAQGRVLELRPDHFKVKPASAPFVSKQKFVFLGNPHGKNAPLAAPEALAYFNPEMFDVDGNLVAENSTVFALPDTVEITGGANPEADGTYITNHMMERFTTTLSKIYLDSVRVIFIADSVPNRLTSFVFEDTINSAGNPVPNFANYRTTAAIASVSIPKALLSPSDSFTVLTIKYNHKLLKTNPDFPNNFYVSLSSSATTSGHAFFQNPPTSANRIRVLTDRVIDQREYDPELDRAWQTRTRDDGRWVQANPFAGRYGYDTDMDGNLDEILFPNLFMIAFVSDGSSIGVNDVKLEGNALGQNFPNPFNPTTEIKYSLKEGGKTTLKVINALGTEVASLVDGYIAAGEHTAKFDGSNLPSGTYFYSLKCGEFSSTKRMVLAK